MILGPIIDGSEDLCEDCHKKFSDSYLLKHFDVQVCDACRLVHWLFSVPCFM